MPIYEFRCPGCGFVVEVLRRLGDETPASCPACGGETERILSAAAVLTRAAAPCGARECGKARTCPSALPGGCCPADA